jgi:hypothetical protein
VTNPVSLLYLYIYFKSALPVLQPILTTNSLKLNSQHYVMQLYQQYNKCSTKNKNLNIKKSISLYLYGPYIKKSILSGSPPSRLTLSLLMSYINMELLAKPEILTSYIYIYIYIYIYVVLRLATLKVVSFYLLHNVSTLNQCRKFSCVTVVCKHFTSDQGYPN